MSKLHFLLVYTLFMSADSQLFHTKLKKFQRKYLVFVSNVKEYIEKENLQDQVDNFNTTIDELKNLLD